MFRPDAIQRNPENTSSVFNNIHNVTVDAISELQKDISPYDITSLVFLLYDNPGTALQRLIFLKRVSKDGIVGCHMNLLCDWAAHAQPRTTWRQEFLEALAECQLFSIIKKLGFNVLDVKSYFSSDKKLTINYIDPIKKVLYKLCENINNNNLVKLKKALLTYDIDVNEYDACELILLELLSQKIICTGKTPDLTNRGIKCDLKKLVTIVENCQGLISYAKLLCEAENHINCSIDHGKFLCHSTPEKELNISDIKEERFVDNVKDKNVHDSIELISKLIEENLTLGILKADAIKQCPDFYEIENPERVGLCYIINQEHFYPSKYSIENKVASVPLEDREGSFRDKEILKKTMESLKFHVEISEDLIHTDIVPSIKQVIINKVQDDDSIFVLCILSHGVEGHVYGVDSVPVAVKNIERLLDSKDAYKLRQKPKVLIIQACQTVHDKEPSKLIADGPSKVKRVGENYFLPQSDTLLLWATAPEFEAYRLNTKGSIFILLLCLIILQNDKNRHFAEICTKLTHDVSHYIACLDHAQLPIYKSTLRKNLYLRMPVMDNLN